MGLSSGAWQTRWAIFALLSVSVLFVSVVIAPNWQAAHAQEGGEGGGASEEGQAESSNIFRHIIKSAFEVKSGAFVFGMLLVFTSIGLFALIVLLAMDLRMATCIPPIFVEEFTDTVNKRRFKEAFDLARNDSSFLGRILTAGMGRLQYGLDDAREAAFNTVESVKAGKEQLITYLATIGTLGPMIGLVGTVFGMILAFMELGRGTPDASKLSKAISHALVLTLGGVALALPAIFCHAFFRNRLIRITMDSANIADDLLTQMYHNSRKPAVSTATTAPTTAPAEPRTAPATARPVT
jgi:biopolymer transport protein ExbB